MNQKYESELPIGFYSKKHLISFVLYVSLCFVVDLFVAIMIYTQGITGWFNVLAIIVVLLQLAVGIAFIPFPVYNIERRFNKNRDFNELKESFENIISNNLKSESKNYVRLKLLRYSIIFDMVYATKLLKDIYMPRKSTEFYQVAYYEAMFEYHIANGNHTKAKNMLDAMAQYKVPKNIFNKYSLLYGVYMKHEISENELMVFNPVSRDFLERVVSQFGLALYYKDKDKEKYDLYKKHINKVQQNNPYFKQLTK